MIEDLSREELDELEESLRKVAEINGDNELYNSLTHLLALPEEHFMILAPGIMQSFQQSLNNPNDKLALVQTLNASGAKVEEVTEALKAVIDSIEDMEIPAMKKDFLKEMFNSIANSMNDTLGIAKRIVNVPIELCNEEAKIPQYAHITDSGMDVYALNDITVKPGETVLVPTGTKIALPPGFEIQVRPKSGTSLKTKLRVANAPGTIDQGYRDEIKVIIENVEAPIKDITVDDDGKVTSIEYGSSYTIGKGEKFCQLVLCEVPRAAFYRVDSVQEIGENRGGGFGSSGLK